MEAAEASSPPAPLVWGIVNAFVVLLSVALMIEILLAQDDRKEIPFATGGYLLYNFGTSALWCVQVSLETMAYWKEHETKCSPSGVRLVLEWMVCAYCLWDSAKLAFAWRVKDADEDLSASFLETLINGVIYCYLLELNIRDYCNKKNSAQYTALSDVSHQGDTE